MAKTNYERDMEDSLQKIADALGVSMKPTPDVELLIAKAQKAGKDAERKAAPSAQAELRMIECPGCGMEFADGALHDANLELHRMKKAAQAEPQEPLPEFECAHQYATKRRLAVTREWIRGWDDCTDYIEGLLKAHGIGKQEGK